MSLRDQCVAAYKMNELPGHDRIDLTGRGNNLISIFPGREDQQDLWIMGSSGGHLVNGGFCYFGAWNRLLTQSEKDDLYNSGSGRTYANITASLKVDPCFYFNLTSGTDLADATGKIPDLTSAGTPGSRTGPGGTGTAADFNGSTQWMYSPDKYGLRIPTLVNTKVGGKKTFSFWVCLDAPTPADATVPYIVGKYGSAAAADVEWLVYYRKITGDLTFWGGQGWATTDPTLCPIKATTFGTPTNGQWCHIIYEFDMATNYQSISINGTKDEWAHSIVPSIPTVLPMGAKFLDSYFFTGATTGRAAEKSLRCNGSDLNGGHYDHSLFAWIAITTLNPGHNQHILGKFNVTGSVIEWSLDFYPPSTLYFQVSDGGGANFYYPSVTISDNLSHSVYCEYEAATKTARISLDNAAFQTMSGAFSPAEVTSYPFKVAYNEVGSAPGEVAGMQFVGEVGPWAKWKRLLTTDERTYLHNLGNKSYYPWDSAVTRSPKLSSKYNLRPAPFTAGGTK